MMSGFRLLCNRPPGGPLQSADTHPRSAMGGGRRSAASQPPVVPGRLGEKASALLALRGGAALMAIGVVAVGERPIGAAQRVGGWCVVERLPFEASQLDWQRRFDGSRGLTNGGARYCLDPHVERENRSGQRPVAPGPRWGRWHNRATKVRLE